MNRTPHVGERKLLRHHRPPARCAKLDLGCHDSILTCEGVPSRLRLGGGFSSVPRLSSSSATPCCILWTCGDVMISQTAGDVRRKTPEIARVYMINKGLVLTTASYKEDARRLV